MSFSVYVTAFDNGGGAWVLPVSEIRARFADQTVHEDSNMLYLSFGHPSLPATELGFEANARGSIKGFFAHHPPEELEFWAIIAGILRDYPCVLYWPGTSAVMGSLELLPHLPKIMVEKLGIPLVSTDPERIRQHVWDHS